MPVQIRTQQRGARRQHGTSLWYPDATSLPALPLRSKAMPETKATTETQEFQSQL